MQNQDYSENQSLQEFVAFMMVEIHVRSSNPFKIHVCETNQTDVVDY